MTPTEKIVDYLEGRVPLSEFYAQVLHDEALQALLEQDAPLPPYIKQGNLFLYIMDQDVSKPATNVNLRDALSKLLRALGVKHQVDTSSLKNYGLVLDASPTWLSPPEAYIKTIVAGFEALDGKQEKLAFAKDKIAKDFRCRGSAHVASVPVLAVRRRCAATVCRTARRFWPRARYGADLRLLQRAGSKYPDVDASGLTPLARSFVLGAGSRQ